MIDYHLHSTFSLDGASPPHSYVKAAEQHDLREIGFAEHLDLDPNLWGFNFLDYPQYFKTLEDLRTTASIPIRCGMEVSYQPRLEGTIRKYLSGTACDFVIGSVHEVNGVTMNHSFFEQFRPQEYFEAVEDLITSGLFDIVGHLEYFRRWGGLYDPSQCSDEISHILQLLIEKNMVLEVNTSGLRHPARSTYPSFEVIRLYRELGGELISLGSDAHHVDCCAFQFSAISNQLKSEGFSVLTTFCRRTIDFAEI